MENMFEYLKNTIEDSIKKEGPKFAESYAQFGFWGNPFGGFESSLHTGFDSLFIGRKEQIEKVSNHLVNSFLGKGEDIAIVAPIGSGCRSFVNLFKCLFMFIKNRPPSVSFESIKNKLGGVVDLRINDFAFEIREQTKKDIDEALNNQKMMLITSFFDDKEYKMGLYEKNNKFDESTITTIMKILEFDEKSADKVIFLTPWRASSWDFLIKESPLLKKVYEKTIILEPFSEKEIIKLLYSRMNYFLLEGKKQTLFDEECLKFIAKFSGGLPRFALEFSFILLNQAIKDNKNKITKDIAKEMLKKYDSYSKIKNKLKELIPEPKSWHRKEKTEKTIFKTIIRLTGENFTSTNISSHMKKSRPAIAKNLSKFEKLKLIKKIISKGEDQRTVPYSLPDFVRAVFEQEFIIPEIKKLKITH